MGNGFPVSAVRGVESIAIRAFSGSSLHPPIVEGSYAPDLKIEDFHVGSRGKGQHIALTQFLHNFTNHLVDPLVRRRTGLVELRRHSLHERCKEVGVDGLFEADHAPDSALSQ